MEAVIITERDGSAQSMNLKEPWYIERAEYNEKTREVHGTVNSFAHFPESLGFLESPMGDSKNQLALSSSSNASSFCCSLSRFIFR